MNEELFPEQIVYNLQRPGFSAAFVRHQQKIYVAYCPLDFEGPSSAIIKLIQGLFDQHRDHSFFILRNRIYSTAPIRAQCQGMVKITAKKASGEVKGIHHGLEVCDSCIVVGNDEGLAALSLLSPENLLPLAKIRELRPDFDTTEREKNLEWLRNVGALNPRGEVLHDYDRDIACLLVDVSGETLAYGVNCNSKNKTLHAEVNMVQRYFRETGKKIPRNAKLYTTRKPCKMCAGMLYDWSEDPSTLHISFAEEDKSSQNTVLDAVVQWNRLDVL